MSGFDCPWPNKNLNPNVKAHWAVKAKFAKKHKQDCFSLCRQAGITAEGNGKIDVFLGFYPPDRRVRDIDNIIASMKSSLDGIALALGVNDSRFRLHTELHDEVVKLGLVRIKIQMADDVDRAEELEDAILSKKIAAAREQAKAIVTSNPTGICLSPGCSGVTGTERRFCDKECARMWEQQ
jgi:crossover junction endodeoxyribonuclease RusA